MNETYSPNTEHAAIELDIQHESGSGTRHVIRHDSTVFVGAGSSCGLAIHGRDVQDMHCMLVFANGQLQVTDWHSGTTIVNGVAVEGEQQLSCGDELRIGENRILVRGWTDQQSEPDLSLSESVSGDEGFSEPNPLREHPAEGLQSTSAEPVLVDDEMVSKLVSEIAPSSPELGNDMLAFSFDPDEAWEDSEAAECENATDQGSLQLEVDQLRADLAQRDAELRELQERESNVSEEVDDETTERLVNRLEDLLDELSQSDQRVLELEKQLRISDDANLAEQEERRQLESWVQEIEQRVSQRESENQAEVENLQRRLDESRDKVSRAEAQIQTYLDSHGQQAEGDSTAMHQLQVNNRELETRVSQLTEEVVRLQKLATDADGLGDAQDRIQELEQKMLQMEVETSRERAEVAREKADLRRTQDELERQMKDHSEMSDSETRLVAMRQHLRERYESERAEREARRQRSLGGRISSLLKSVSR